MTCPAGSAIVRDVDTSPPRAPQAPVAPTASLKHLGIVYDGTPSSAQALADAKLAAEGRQRREKLDQMRGMAATRPGEAKLYDRRLSGNAHIVLEMRRRDGSVLDWLQCDLSVSPREDGSGEELMLIVPCPVCNIFRGRVGEMMTVKQSNRMFSLDERHRGELWVNPNDPTDVYVQAGSINTHERWQCGKCRSKYRVDDNVMRLV